MKLNRILNGRANQSRSSSNDLKANHPMANRTFFEPPTNKLLFRSSWRRVEPKTPGPA
jgi:hypothetical protein